VIRKKVNIESIPNYNSKNPPENFKIFNEEPAKFNNKPENTNDVMNSKPMSYVLLPLFQQIQQKEGIFLMNNDKNANVNMILLKNYMSLQAQLVKNQMYFQKLNELINTKLNN